MPRNERLLLVGPSAPAWGHLLCGMCPTGVCNAPRRCCSTPASLSRLSPWRWAMPRLAISPKAFTRPPGQRHPNGGGIAGSWLVARQCWWSRRWLPLRAMRTPRRITTLARIRLPDRRNAPCSKRSFMSVWRCWIAATYAHFHSLLLPICYLRGFGVRLARTAKTPARR